MMNKLSVCVIGGGIHGLTSAVALAKAGYSVTVLEKNKDILQGTSGATHNRAHVGYHYPRSTETALECIRGLNHFKQTYPDALSYPSEIYYLISKNSKTTTESFKDFCDCMKYPYEMVLPSDEFVNKDLLVSGFKVVEPIFNIFKLKSTFKKLAKQYNIKIRTSSEVVNCYARSTGGYTLKVNQSDGTSRFIQCSIILNATYAYSNNVLKVLDLAEDMTEYQLQHTEVAILRSKKYIPSLTVMDGPYVSLMPYATDEPNLYLLYDVVNSVLDREKGYFFKDRVMESNAAKMIEHCKVYFPFELEYVSSVYGSRPIIENVQDSRKTRIISHEKHPGIYSILEGKFISAPLIADNIVSLIKQNS